MNTINTIAIEKGIPIKEACKKWGHVREALKKMEPGDSFEMEATTSEIHSVASAINIAVKVRKTENPGFVRVWRA